MSGGSPSPHGARRSPTRALLQVAAFAALQVIVIVVLTPVLGRLAAWFPPVYALVACTQTFLLFAARRFTGLARGATLAAGITALVCAPFTPLGWLLAVPLMAAGVLFDLVLRAAQRRRWTEHRDSLVSGVVVGAALFAVSLPVMSPEHLGPVILGLTLLARVVATAAGALLSARLVRQLERVGVSRSVSPR